MQYLHSTVTRQYIVLHRSVCSQSLSRACRNIHIWACTELPGAMQDSKRVCTAGLLMCLASFVSYTFAQDVPCGQFVQNTDLVGDNLPGSGRQTANDQACLDLCEATEICNAMIRIPDGRCFLKNVPENFEHVTQSGFTSHIMCPCGQFVPNMGIMGDNMRGSGAKTESNQACLDLCESSPTCNAVVRIPDGRCFLKSVPVDVERFTMTGRTSYLMCDDDEDAPTPPTHRPPTPPPPPPGPPANPWRSLKSLPAPIGEVASGVLTLDGKPYLLVVGVQDDNDPNAGATMIYDIFEDMWIEGAARPILGDHHAAAVFNNQLYLLGGCGLGTPCIAVPEVQIGTLSRRGGSVSITWITGADVPAPSGSPISAMLDGKVYYCGGIQLRSTIDVCQVYDIATNTWASRAQAPPSMPVGRNHAASCTDGEKFFSFGGRSRGKARGPGFADTLIYTPGGSWTRGADLPLARGGMGACVCTGGKCYVFGGEVEAAIAPSPISKINSQRIVYRTDIYDISSDSWTAGRDMPLGLHGIFPVLHDGKVYISGGGASAGASLATALFEYIPE